MTMEHTMDINIDNDIYEDMVFSKYDDYFLEEDTCLRVKPSSYSCYSSKHTRIAQMQKENQNQNQNHKKSSHTYNGKHGNGNGNRKGKGGKKAHN